MVTHMKKIKLFLAALLAIVGASSMKALEPAGLVGNYTWKYRGSRTYSYYENTVTIAENGTKLVIKDMFPESLEATIQEEGGDTYLVIAKGQRGTYNGNRYEVQGSADGSSGWGEADIKGKIGGDGVITFDCYLRASIVDMPNYVLKEVYDTGSTFTPLSGELPSVVELPAGATVEEYQLAYKEGGKRKTKAVGVAIVGSDVYVQGFADFLPEAWVKGTISGNNWTFSANQYLGKLENDDCYFFSNGKTTFTYNGKGAYVASQVYGKVAGVVSALYYEPELSEEFDPVPYATISSDGENMTFRYDLDYYSASEEVGTSFSHVYRLPWTGYQPEWWNDAETLKKIKKVSFYASFGEYDDITDLYGFFAGMENLTTIEGLEYLVTKNAKHTASMFNGCKSLTSLDLSTFDTSGITDGTMASMFNGCASLKSITFGEKFSTAGANAMQDMFAGCEALESLDLSKFDTGKVTNMANMFSGCKSLKSITFGEDFKASGVKDMNNMFYNCQALKSLDLSSFDTGNVTDMQYMFAGCKALEELDVSNFNTEKVTTMQGMFYGCKALKELDLSNFNTGKVKTMSYMFYQCQALETLNLSSFNIGNVQEMYSMFQDCSSLQTIYSAENADWRNEYSGGMFRLCNKLSGKFGSKEFSFAEHPMDDGTYAKVYTGNDDIGGYFTSIKEKREAYAVLDGSTLTFYYDGNKPTTGTVYDLPWEANTFAPWARKTEITAVEFNESFADYDGLTNLYGMFADLTKLTAITGLGYLNTENVENMAYMFYACTSLESLDVSSFNTENVTNMRNMFYNCNKLETLDVNSFNTENVTNMTNMFAGCKFTTLYCNKNWAKDDLLSDGMFNVCTNLVGGNGTVYDASHVDAAYAHPDGESNPGYFTEREAYAIAKLNHPEDESDESRTLTFYYDNMKAQRSKEPGVSSDYVYKIPWDGTQPKWTSHNSVITAANFNPSFADYKGLTSTCRMFYGMTNLKAIDNLQFLNTQNVTDMSTMFMWCQNENLTELDVSKFNTAKVTDMNNMFYMCTHVEALDVSKFNTAKVTNMNGMFSNCQALEELDLSNFDTGNVTDMNSMFGNCYALKSLNVSSFDTGNVTDMKNMFSGCTVLPSLDVSSFDTGNVTDMSFMFKSCSKLTSLDLSSFDTKNVTTMRDMFSSCSSLESIDLSSFDTKNVTMMGSMFADCKNLPMLDVSSFNVKSVTNMNSMFMNCEKLTTIFCLDDWKEMCEAEDLNSSYMFSGCNVLKGVVPYNRNNSNDVDYANPTTGYFAPFYDLTVTEAGMATLYLGFQAEIPEDVNAYLCYAEDLTGNKPYALAHKFEDSYLPKETAVFVTAEPGTYRFKYYYVEPGYVINFISDFLDGNILTGTLEEMPVEPHSVLTLGYSNQTDDLGFWWYTGTTIPANRAYIPGDKLTEGGVKGIRIVFDEETGIATTNLTNQTNEAGAWYTIDGRKLEGKPQQRGLYINNGKKIMVK